MHERRQIADIMQGVKGQKAADKLERERIRARMEEDKQEKLERQKQQKLAAEEATAAAQAAAMAISGFNGGTLNGPTSGGFRPGLRPIAPIHRPFDEDDDLGWRPYHRDDDQGDEDDVGFHRAVQHRISKFRL